MDSCNDPALVVAEVVHGTRIKVKGERIKDDKMVKRHSNGWMPVFTGMTVIICT